MSNKDETVYRIRLKRGGITHLLCCAHNSYRYWFGGGEIVNFESLTEAKKHLRVKAVAAAIFIAESEKSYFESTLEIIRVERKWVPCCENDPFGPHYYTESKVEVIKQVYPEPTVLDKIVRALDEQ